MENKNSTNDNLELFELLRVSKAKQTQIEQLMEKNASLSAEVFQYKELYLECLLNKKDLEISLNKEKKDLEMLLVQRDKELSDIFNSNSWKFVVRLQKLRNLFLK